MIAMQTHIRMGCHDCSGAAHVLDGGIAARLEREADVRQLLEVIRLDNLKGRLRAAGQKHRLEPALGLRLR